MTEQPDHTIEPVRLDADEAPRPEEEIADAGPPDLTPAAPPTEQLDLSGEPAQGSGAADSY